jgi:hypothetical protein
VQKQTISSASTFWMKFVFPPLWISGFGFGAFILWFGLARGKHGELPPAAMKYAFAILWVIGTSFIIWIAVRIKRVQIDGANLYVSTGLREIAVPITEIGSVKELRWIKGHPITIGFKKATACGTSIMFLPKLRLGFWSKHPVVEELQRWAGLVPDPAA